MKVQIRSFYQQTTVLIIAVSIFLKIRAFMIRKDEPILRTLSCNLSQQPRGHASTWRVATKARGTNDLRFIRAPPTSFVARYCLYSNQFTPTSLARGILVSFIHFGPDVWGHWHAYLNQPMAYTHCLEALADELHANQNRLKGITQASQPCCQRSIS
ncbi:hypothetical protein GQ44DRAFT_364870 [Phaeosphaeriaceae sp. PMI808]|nr:hypothetical protein GQ44DRAFT_364870 [Phaeosphaeriaceae sp. PMI808]